MVVDAAIELEVCCRRSWFEKFKLVLFLVRCLRKAGTDLRERKNWGGGLSALCIREKPGESGTTRRKSWGEFQRSCSWFDDLILMLLLLT